MFNNFSHRSLRVISILFIVFLSTFSLDVFNEYQGLAIFPALFMHLLVPLILLIAAIVAWKWNLIGAIIFLSFAVYYVYAVGFDRHWSWYASISIPSAIIGLLFLINWFRRRKIIK